MYKYKHSMVKTETLYVVVLLIGSNCEFEDYRHSKFGHCTFILVQVWAILCQRPKRLMIFDVESKH